MIELTGEYETFVKEFFNQDENPSEEATKKIWDNRKKAAFLVLWQVKDNGNNINRLLLDNLESPQLLELKSIDDLKAWVQETKAKI